MKSVGAIVLSFEEAGDLTGLLPWKTIDWKALSADLKQEENTALTGILHISTCNRVEFIYTLNDATRHTDFALSLMEKMPRLKANVRPSFLQGRDAVRHLLRLAAGLESLVLGESEIKAQIKDSYQEAEKLFNLDRRLRALMRNVFQEAKMIRTEIPVGHLPLSVATLAVKKVHIKAGENVTVVIGSGPMSRQAAEYVSKNAGKLVIVNRTLEKVQPIADRLNAKAVGFDDFFANPAQVGRIGAIITATSRPDSFINPEFLSRINRNGHLSLIDMALPPDVDSACADIEGVQMTSMETLREELDKNRQKRARAAEEASSLIEEALVRLEAALISGLSGSLMKEIQKDVRDKSREHLDRLLKGRLSHLTGKDRKMIYNWAIQANRELNRIHRRGLEALVREYLVPGDELSVKGERVES